MDDRTAADPHPLSLDQFANRLDALGRRAAELADRLVQSLDALRNSGAALCAELLEELVDYSSALATLESDLEQAASAAGVASDGKGGGSIAWLRQRADEVVKAADRVRSSRAVRAQIIAALNRLTVLTSTDPTAEPLAEHLRTEAVAFSELVNKTEAVDLEAVLERAAAFQAIDQLTREGQDLRMGELADLASRAATAFSFEVVLAITSGRIIPAREPNCPEYSAPASNGARKVAANEPIREPEGAKALPLEETPLTSPQKFGDEPDQTADARILSSGPSLEHPSIEDADEVTASTNSNSAENSYDVPMSDQNQIGENTSEKPEDELAPVPSNERANPTQIGVLEPDLSPPEALTVNLRGQVGLSLDKALEAVREADPASQPAALYNVICCLIRDNRLGPALHLTRNLELSGHHPEVPSELIEALALSSGLRGPGAEVASRVRDALHLLASRFARLGDDVSTNDTPTSELTLVAFAAGLRPTLLAQGTGAPELLARLNFRPDFAWLAKLRDVALEPSQIGLVLTPAQLKGANAGPQWQTELDELKRSVDNWLTRERLGRVIYKAAADVWHRWLRDEGPIGRMLGRVLRDEWGDESRREARSEAQLWSDRTHVDRQLHRTDQDLRQIGAKRRPIDARSVTALRDRCKEAVGLVDAWLGLLDQRPERSANWVDERVYMYRQELSTAIDQSRSALAAMAGGPGLPCEAALAVLQRVIVDLSRLLDPAIPDEPPPLPHHRLNADLLRLVDIELDDRWEPLEPGADSLRRSLLEALAEPERPWFEVIEACWDRLDFLTAERVLDLIEPSTLAADDTDAEPANFRDEHDRRLRESRADLRAGLDLLEQQIDKARLKGLVDEDERLTLINRISTVDPTSLLGLDRGRRELESVHADFAATKRRRTEALELQFAELGLTPSHPAYDRVRSLIDTEDLVTAHEYLALLDTGAELPDAEPIAPGFDFFDPQAEAGRPNMFSRLEPLFFGKERLKLRDIARKLGERQSLAGIDIAELLTPGQALQARRVLDSWSELRFGGRDPRGAVQIILDYLGFRVKALRELPDPPSGARRFDLEAEPFESRNECLLPEYGSRCHGRYQIVCLDRQPLEEDLLKLVGPERRSHPVLAFYLGAMSARRRRDLAHALRRRPAQRLLVLDDLLLLYIALQKRRTAAFFNAASQFGHAESYVTTSSQIPPEMFFGRGREIESVFQPDGTNLVYGGRQLGKTALLNEVSRRYHRPELGVVVELINLLHDEHIGLNRSLDDIWAVIAARLQPHGVISPTTRRPETVGDQMVQWLDADVARRIVLLLDEADLFLNSDSKEGWPRVGKLKSLMERTGRRFKVVFAGLHNVQRTSHDVNTPLAHLGTAICVGPFLSHADMRDAADMVSLPFRALGYYFERPELVARIVAQANYYPSLIQILCQQLLKRLGDSQNAAFDPNRTPPYSVRLADLENAFADPEVRRQIYDRFRWTIELDNRYRVIALCLALETSEAPDPAARGSTLAEIRDWALAVWPQGFAESAGNDAFRSLLDEMCELGVLRPRGGGRYVMRSPNVVRLLGTRDDIWQALEDAAKVPEKIEYEAKSFRRVYDQHSKWRRSPLTADQESRLRAPNTHGLFTLFGTRAAGLDEVVPFLRVLASTAEAGPLTVNVADDLLDIATFQQRLDGVLQSRDDGITLVVIDSHCPWSEEWVVRAADALTRRTGAKRRFIKIVFIGDPAAAWLWSEPNPGLRTRLEGAGLVELTLRPWADAAVRLWKKEAEFGEDTDGDSRLFRNATGNWCAFLHEAGRRCLKKPHDWKSVVGKYFGELREGGAALALGDFGIVPDAITALRIMAEFADPVDAAQFHEVLEMDGSVSSPEFVERVLRWADSLALLRPAGDGRWVLDPFLAEVLTAGPNDAQP